jgi:hypothetical protein
MIGQENADTNLESHCISETTKTLQIAWLKEQGNMLQVTIGWMRSKQATNGTVVISVTLCERFRWVVGMHLLVHASWHVFTATWWGSRRHQRNTTQEAQPQQRQQSKGSSQVECRDWAHRNICATGFESLSGDSLSSLMISGFSSVPPENSRDVISTEVRLQPLPWTSFPEFVGRDWEK